MPTDEITCCGILEEIRERGFELPFDRPITFNTETGEMQSYDWAIKLLKLTPKGNISKTGSTWAFINYCPFCGEELRNAK